MFLEKSYLCLICYNPSVCSADTSLYTREAFGVDSSVVSGEILSLLDMLQSLRLLRRHLPLHKGGFWGGFVCCFWRNLISARYVTIPPSAPQTPPFTQGRLLGWIRLLSLKKSYPSSVCYNPSVCSADTSLYTREAILIDSNSSETENSYAPQTQQRYRAERKRTAQ